MSLAESITGVAGKVLDKFVQDKDLKAKLDQEMKMAFHEANLAQIELNKEDKKNKLKIPNIGWHRIIKNNNQNFYLFLQKFLSHYF